MNIKNITNNLKIDDSGIWKSNKLASFSYPENAHGNCFQIEDKSFWFQHRNDVIAFVIKNYPPKGCIYDIGGGNGFVASRLIDDGFKSVLIEPGCKGAYNAKIHRKLPHVICSNVEDIQFNQNLQAIGLFDVLEHIEDDSGFINILYSLMDNDGLLYLTVPAFQSLWSLSDKTACHFRRYNKHSLLKLFEDKFEILFFSYFFNPLMIPIFLFRALPYKLNLNKRKKLLKSESEHGIKKSFFAKFIKKSLKIELKRIHKKKEISFGTSCILAAKKINN